MRPLMFVLALCATLTNTFVQKRNITEKAALENSRLL